jgi:hypothetical protein
MEMSRREVLMGGTTAMIATAGLARESWSRPRARGATPGLVVYSAKVTTLRGGRPEQPQRRREVS